MSKKLLTFLFGGQIGTGPLPIDIGGKGIALTIFALTFIAFFNWGKVIVEIKLIIVCVDLNFKSLIILSPTVGVTDKKTHSHLSTICWLFLAIIIFLNFCFKFLAILLFLGEIIILLNKILDVQIPVITDDAILPVPINPHFLIFFYFILFILV